MPSCLRHRRFFFPDHRMTFCTSDNETDSPCSRPELVSRFFRNARKGPSMRPRRQHQRRRVPTANGQNAADASDGTTASARNNANMNRLRRATPSGTSIEDVLLYGPPGMNVQRRNRKVLPHPGPRLCLGRTYLEARRRTDGMTPHRVQRGKPRVVQSQAEPGTEADHWM